MPADFTPLEGGCACGGVRFRLTRAPLIVHCCHCSACQRETGSAFVVNALVESAHVELLEGQPRLVTVATDSGKGQAIHRCPTCQVAVYSHYLGFIAGVSFVRVGTLDDPRALAPDVHIYTRSKQPWLTLPDDVPQHEGYYAAKSTWSASTLARVRALRAVPD